MARAHALSSRHQMALASAATVLLMAWHPQVHAQVQAQPDTPATAHAAPAPSTRAKVIADLILWRRVGADRYQTDAMNGANQAEYEEAVAAYEKLRHSPAYDEEVARVSHQLGEAH